MRARTSERSVQQSSAEHQTPQWSLGLANGECRGPRQGRKACANDAQERLVEGGIAAAESPAVRTAMAVALVLPS